MMDRSRLALMTLACSIALTGMLAAETTPTPKEYLIHQLPAAPTIDAKLGDWKGIEPTVIDPTGGRNNPALIFSEGDPDNRIGGAADISGKVYLAWDMKNLYWAAQVRDDNLRGFMPDTEHNVGPAGWFGDSVMMQLHSFRQPLKTNTPYQAFPMLIMRYLVHEGGRGKLTDRRDIATPNSYWKLPKGSKLASRETEDGYIVESAIPWASLAFKPQAGELLFASFLLTDTDQGQLLNQLGWNWREQKQMAVFRLLGRPDAMGLLSLGSDQVTAGAPLRISYRVDALARDVQLTRLELFFADKQGLVQRVDVKVPKGKTARDVVSVPAVSSTVGPAEAQLSGTINGRIVVLAKEAFTVVPAKAVPPRVQDPAGEVYRMRPDRIEHNAADDRWRQILRHGYITGKKGYERYILTHVKGDVERVMPNAVKIRAAHSLNDILASYTLYRVTGQQRYADWTRAGLEIALEHMNKSTDPADILHTLVVLMKVRSFVWQNDPDSTLAPPGIEEEIGRQWVRVAKDPPSWMFLEYGFHNRCWHRWAYIKIMDYYARKLKVQIDPRYRQYIQWHEAKDRPVALGDSTDNSTNYHWVFFRYPVLWHMTEGTLDQLGKHPGYLAALTRYRQHSGPSGVTPHFGDGSGWLTGVGPALAYYELMGRVTKDGRFRWQAHRIAEYLYNHFWPRHNQYHGPQDGVNTGFCLAWLWADESVKPVERSRASRMTMRPRVVALKPEEEDRPYGFRRTKFIADLAPDKLILSSGNRAESLWSLVELVDKGGHCGQLPGHVASLMRHDAALLAGQGYYERSQDFNNVVWVEDLDGVPADPRPIRTEVPRFVEDRDATYVRIRVLRYGKLPVTSERDIVFVKDAFVLVKDRLTFHKAMKVRVGPCWQTRNVGPQSGTSWFNAYYDQLYHTGLGQGRGIHAFRNPAWDLLVSFSPRKGYRQSLLDRYDENPYRNSPVRMRQSWAGIVKAGQVLTFTTVLLPHKPAFDVTPFAKRVEFLVDDNDNTLVRVQHDAGPLRREQLQTIWVQLHEGRGAVSAKGWACDARLAVVKRDHKGNLRAPLLVDGKQLTVDGTDLGSKARQGKMEVKYLFKDDTD